MKRANPHLLGLAAMIGGMPLVENLSRGDMLHTDQLPIKGFSEEFRVIFRAAGGKIGEISKDDPLFFDVTLPAGWCKKSTDHYLYTDLFDAKGLRRASIFYKGAAWDRDAFITPLHRFGSGYHCDDWELPFDEQICHPQIKDSNGTIFWRGELIKEIPREEMPHKTSSTDVCRKIAHDVLAAAYPLYAKLDAYWDLDQPVFPAWRSTAPTGIEYTIEFTCFTIERVEPYKGFGGNDSNFFDYEGGYLHTQQGYTAFKYKSEGSNAIKKLRASDAEMLQWWKELAPKRWANHCAKLEWTIKDGNRLVAQDTIITQALPPPQRVKKRVR